MILIRYVLAGSALAAALPLAAQQAPSPNAPFAEQLSYLLGQSSGGFAALRGDSIGPGMWRVRYLIATTLDSATALTASSVTELDRQHADGRAGKAIVGVFPLGLIAPGDSLMYARYREMIAAGLTGWQACS